MGGSDLLGVTEGSSQLRTGAASSSQSAVRLTTVATFVTPQGAPRVTCAPVEVSQERDVLALLLLCREGVVAVLLGFCVRGRDVLVLFCHWGLL